MSRVIVELYCCPFPGICVKAILIALSNISYETKDALFFFLNSIFTETFMMIDTFPPSVNFSPESMTILS